MSHDPSNPTARRTTSLVEGLRVVMEGRAEKTPIAFGLALEPATLEGSEDAQDAEESGLHLASRAHEVALHQLPPQLRSHFRSVANCLGAAGSAEAEAALSRLLLEERLDTGRALVGQASLLATLARLAVAGQDVALAELVRELDAPGFLPHVDGDAGAPATAALYLARRHPVEYARLVVELALEGRAETAGGATLLAGALGDDAAVTERLGWALLRLGRMGHWSSSATTPESGGTFRGLFAGRSQSGTARMVSALTGRAWVTETPDALGHWNLDLLADAQRRLAEGQVPLAGLELIGGVAHVQLESIRTGPEGTQIHYLRPSGKPGALDAEEFLQRASSYSFER